MCIEKEEKMNEKRKIGKKTIAILWAIRCVERKYELKKNKTFFNNG